jgi:peptidoglycan/xylan/chitin deacetylase (PgdA/CDA1 family)
MFNRIVKMSISICFYIIYWLYIKIKLLLGRHNPGTCAVLCYHGIQHDQREKFALQMDDLIRYAKPVPLDIASPLEMDKHHAAVTFDDGLMSVLSERNIASTIFVPTGYLGQKCTWMRSEEELLRDVGKRIPERDRIQKLHDSVMNADNLREIKSKLVSIQSHGVSHTDLVNLKAEDAKKELLESKNRLETILQQQVKFFSFPRGKYNEYLIQLAQDVGYKRVFSISPYLAFSNLNEYVTGRIVVEPTDWSLEFRLKLFGAYRWISILRCLGERYSYYIRR